MKTPFMTDVKRDCSPRSVYPAGDVPRGFWRRLLTLLGLAVVAPWAGAEVPVRPISLADTVIPTPLIYLRRAPLVIKGGVTNQVPTPVRVRVTTSQGMSLETVIEAKNGRFECRYPDSFTNGIRLGVGTLFIDATTDSGFDVWRPGHFQAEATMIVHNHRRDRYPEFSSVFVNDFRDKDGSVDRASRKWSAIRELANLYMASQAAHETRIGRPSFEMASSADLSWFKAHLSLYDFARRDRDWTLPVENRPGRTFWQASPSNWFNASNDNSSSGDPTQFMPYAFANDFADLLIIQWMRTKTEMGIDDNLVDVCRDATENLLAMQHRGADSFALAAPDGTREKYTAGSFRYGMFADGRYMTEGTGWFSRPESKDHLRGGVFNGRAIWALGEALQHDPNGPQVARVQAALALALKFCLRDGRDGGYTKRTRSGLSYWRDAGENAYMLLGMLAACEVTPELPIVLDDPDKPVALRNLCVLCLNALCELERVGHQWTAFPDVDAMCLSALSQGMRVLRGHPDEARWAGVASDVANAWLSARIDAKERTAPTPHFGRRLNPGLMTFVWPESRAVRISFYTSAHWMQALSDLYAVTGEKRYRERAEAIASYLCGNNPFQARIFNELGGVYNWVDDTDGDGIEDQWRQDMYPESTAFTQIAILHLIEAISDIERAPQ